jgi:hypothetical protein
MAGDWLAACKDLPEKPEVVALSNATGLPRLEVAGFLLWRFWAWADGQTVDGGLPGVTVANLAEMFGRPASFWEALRSVGWLDVEPAGVRIPKFCRWMGEGGKKRLARNAKQARWRAGLNVDASVDHNGSTKPSTSGCHRDVDGLVDRLPSTSKKTPISQAKNGHQAENCLFPPPPEKEREKSPPTPPPKEKEKLTSPTARVGKGVSGGKPGKPEPEGFPEFWAAYPRKTAKAKARESWERLRPDDGLRATIISALARQKDWPQWLRGIIPHAATWLNQRRWEDEEPGPSAPSSRNGRDPVANVHKVFDAKEKGSP